MALGFQAIRKGSIAGMTIAILHIHAGLSYVLYWNLTLERVGPYHLITRASLSILLFISRKSATLLLSYFSDHCLVTALLTHCISSFVSR